MTIPCPKVWPLTWLLVVTFFTGCDHPTPPPATPANPATNAVAGKTYDLHGIIQAIPPDRKNVTIKHDAVADYMPAMTMELPVHDTNELAGLAPNDEIACKLRVTDTEDWLEEVRFIAHHITASSNGVVTIHVPSQQLQPGEPMPDFAVTGEDGRRWHFSDFHGQALAFTFFFTACPLPEFCPRMNKNLAATRTLLQSATNGPANWQLLSISFDSEFDKPELLGNYGNFYRGADTNRWLFSVADPNTLAGLAPKVGLNFWRESGTISHNLRTVVLDAQGNFYKQFEGNSWTAEELAQAIREAAVSHPR